MSMQKDERMVRVHLLPELRDASLTRLAAARTSASSAASSVWTSQQTQPAHALLPELLDLSGVRRLKVSEATIGLVSECAERWRSLTVLDVSGAGLSQLPDALAHLERLEHLHVDRNKLSSLPKAIESLSHLRELTADSNAICSASHELASSTNLRRVSFENNRLSSPPADLPALASIEELYLGNNPLESMPDILHCKQLEQLSLMNVTVRYDRRFGTVSIVTGDTPPCSPSYFFQNFRYSSSASNHLASSWATFCSLIFKHTSCQHLLLASTIAHMCETKAGCDAVMKADGSLAQLLAMAVSSTWRVTFEACNALKQLALESKYARKMVEANALESVLSLLSSPKEAIRELGLELLSNISYTSQHASYGLMTEGLLGKLEDLIKTQGRCASGAMRALGNLAFESNNATKICNKVDLRMMLEREAQHSSSHKPTGSEALRVLAILGENRAVDRALGKAEGPYRRGVRILSMDGGGMKGLATIKMLERIESGTGKRIHELFDIIGGTSTGGVLAVALGVRRMTLQQCREIYTRLSKNVFRKSHREENPSWRDHISSLYASGTQSVRFAVTGSKHDAAEFETLLRERCRHQGREMPLVDAGLGSGPRVFVMATRVSNIPAEPFVFRTYAHSPQSGESPLRGSCRHLVWHGVRASSAAPYYLADFACDGERWQDGGVSCNNPSVVAVQEARSVWPDCDIDCIVSLGSGEPPTKEREVSSISRYIDAGTAVVESACSVDRADEALSTLCSLLPGCKYYRFQPIDDACNIELDDNDDTLLRALEDATSNYIDSDEVKFEAACSHLLSKRVRLNESKWGVSSPRPSITRPRAQTLTEAPEGVSTAVSGATSCQLDMSKSIEDTIDTLEIASDGRLRRPRSIVLGLHANLHGLVLSWKQTPLALSEIEDQCQSILRELRIESVLHLPREFVSSVADGTTQSIALYRTVSSTTQLGTQQQYMNAALLERYDPEIVLDRSRILRNRHTWQGLAIALASERVPMQVIEGFLEVGARLVATIRAFSFSNEEADGISYLALRRALDDILRASDEGDDPVAELSQHECAYHICLYAWRHAETAQIA